MKKSVPASMLYPPRLTGSKARRINTGGCGYRRMDSLMTRVVYTSSRISATVGLRSPTTRSTSSNTLALTSGCLASRNVVHVNTAAVVSCPAMRSVIKSSRNCLDVTSSPLAIKKCKMLGSSVFMYSSTNSSSSSSTTFLHLEMSSSNVSFTTSNAS